MVKFTRLDSLIRMIETKRSDSKFHKKPLWRCDETDCCCKGNFVFFDYTKQFVAFRKIKYIIVMNAQSLNIYLFRHGL